MEPTILIAFFGGILSILSPCILPLIPAYFAYISGTVTSSETSLKTVTLTSAEASSKTVTPTKSSKSKPTQAATKAVPQPTTSPSNNKNQILRTLLHAILFVAGFSVVFILFGAVIGSTGKFLLTNKRTVEIIGGIIIILFAIQTSGLLRKGFLNKLNLLSFLEKEKRFSLQFKNNLTNNSANKNANRNSQSTENSSVKSIHSSKFNSQKASPLKSLLAGGIFAFGWSPCYGPILGSILTLAVSETNFNKGILLFAAYSLGMAIPLILLALLSSKLTIIINKTKTFRKYFSVIMAILLLILGLWMITGETSFLANTINNLYIKYNINL
jgi:cytochrome c-type biogenesis protein